MHYWLMKSEPSDVSIDDLAAKPAQTIGWYGIRNFQARNFMRDQMKVGELDFFYHSSCKEPGIVGIVEIITSAYPDPTQFDASSHYFDPKATPANPRWQQVDVQLRRKTRLLGLPELRGHDALSDMVLLHRGNRLSITPVTTQEWHYIEGLLVSEAA